jgi:hypothetical protein
VDWIDIYVDSNRIFVPRSVFCNLADLDSGVVEAGDSSHILRMTAGDASEFYCVKIIFTKQGVTRRILYDPEFSDQPFEETVYRRLTVP